jgi:hypothetical protein
MTLNNFDLKQILSKKEYQKYLKISILKEIEKPKFNQATNRLIENIVVYGE